MGNKRDSSSSEEHIDSSEELIDIDMDVHDKFIADCAAEATAAKNRKRSYPESEPEQPVMENSCEKAETLI